MEQKAISASSKYWDDKQISLTEKTKKTIIDKAKMLDAETLFAQYQLEGDDAIKAMEQNGITEEQLLNNPNTYIYLGVSAINDLETNASKSSRVNAIINLTKLGFTNIYEENTKNFITPPEEPAEEKPVEQPEPEEESRYQYLKRTRPVQHPEPQVQYEPQRTQYQEPQETEVEPSVRETVVGAARFIPNAVRRYMPIRNERATRAVHPTAKPTKYVNASKFQSSQPRQSPQSQPHSLLNREVALKLGGKRINPVAPTKRTVPKPTKVSPRPKFGLRVKRRP